MSNDYYDKTITMTIRFLTALCLACGLYSSVLAQSSAWSGYISYFERGVYSRDANIPICNYVKNGTMRIDPPNHHRNEYWTNYDFDAPICVEDNFSYEIRFRNSAAINGIAAYDAILELKSAAGLTGFTLMSEAWAQNYTNVKVTNEVLISNSPNLVINYSNWTVLKMKFENKTVSCYYNDKLFFSKPYNNNVCNLNGFYLRFKGSAAIDWVRITNDEDKTVVYNEDFQNCTSIEKPTDCIAALNIIANKPCEGDSLKLSTTTIAKNYEWTGPNGFRSTQKDPIISKTDNLTSGVYSLKSQFNACHTLTQTVNVVLSPIPKVNLGKDTSVCNGQAYNLDAGISGTTYKWSSGSTARLLSIKSSGTYSVTVTTAGGCKASDTVKIDIPALALLPNIVVKKPSCYGKCDGEVTANANGGFGAPYQYRWSGGRTTPNVVSRCAGDINLTVTDSKGCKIETVASITQPSKIDAVAWGDTIYNGYAVRCANSEDGQATVKPSGGVGNYTIVWQTNPLQLDRTAKGLKADTTYKVFVYDKNGCNDSTTIKLIAPPPVEAQFNIKSPHCAGDKNGEIIFEGVKGGVAPYTFSFKEKNYSFIGGASMRLGNLVSGEYEVLASDANGCTESQVVEIPAPPSMSFFTTTDTLIHFGDDILLFAKVNTPSVLSDVKWIASRDSVGLDCENCPTTKASPRFTTFFKVIAHDTFGCEMTKEILVKVDKRRKIYVPTAFSPNEDGENDYFMVHGGTGTKRILNFSIFNRWGALMHQVRNFTPDDDSKSWNGKYNGSELPADTYIWFMEVEFDDGEREIFKGDVSLLR